MTASATKEEVQQAKDALRKRMAQIYHDFDHRTGRFRALAYCSPRDLVMDAWAECAGRSVSEFRDAVTAWRTNDACKNGVEPWMSKVIDDLKSGVERWRQATRYKRKLVGRPPLEKYNNRSELVSYISGTLAEIGLDDPWVSRYPDQLGFGARFTDAFRHRVSVGGQVKFAYGGGLRGRLQFPYYDYQANDPSKLSIEGLIGLPLCTFLGVDPPDCMIWIADHGKDAFPNIDGYLTILSTVCDYLRSPDELR